jgi:hypothetical protein
MYVTPVFVVGHRSRAIPQMILASLRHATRPQEGALYCRLPPKCPATMAKHAQKLTFAMEKAYA